MFKKLSLGILVLSIITFGIPINANAQENEVETAVPTTTSVEPVTMTDDSTEEMTPEQRKAKAEERIKAAKDKMASKISAAQEKRIASVCKSAQTKVEKLQANISNIVENRQEKYTKVSTKLAEVSAKLKAAGADTTELDAAIAGMESKITEVTTELEDYNTSLSDLAIMDCEEDPSGFKAALETARTQRTEAVLLTGTVKTYVNETIKPILQTLRSSLTTNTTTEEGDAN
jgi:chromosome segregation ATPase